MYIINCVDNQKRDERAQLWSVCDHSPTLLLCFFFLIIILLVCLVITQIVKSEKDYRSNLF